MEKHNEKKLKNMLSDRAKYHRKFQKGMSPFCSLTGEPISIGGGMCESVSIPDTIDAKKYITQSIGKKNFIDREGNLIRIKGDHIDTLRDIIGDTTDTFEMSERDYDAHMNAINNHFLKRLGWIQISKEFVPHIAIHRRPTPSQEATLIRVMDDYSRRPYDLNLYLYDTGNPVWKKYNLTETVPEEVMKRIYRYFNTGILSEDVSFEGKAMFCPSCGHRTLFFDGGHNVWSCSECRKNYKYKINGKKIEFMTEAKLKEDFVRTPEVGKSYYFSHNNKVLYGEFLRATRAFNIFSVDGQEVYASTFGSVSTDKESIENLLGLVDKMERDTKVPNKMRAYNGKFFPVSEGIESKFPGRAQLIGALKTFDSNGKSSTRGNWRIANGGYDLAFEVYYNNTPVAQGYTDGTLSTDFDTTEFGFSKGELRDVITSVYSDMRTSGNILSEAFEKGVKVYEVEKDGPPEVGRQIIAFVDSHEEYTILTRQDKDYVAKQNWDDKEGHKSEDGEYYSGKNGWIYSLGYTKYVYLDELDLVPQRHHDKVEKEKQAGVAQKQAITDKLISIYGEELGNKLAEKCISVSKDGRRVELAGYDKNLIQVAGYASALKSLYDSMSNEFGPDIAKEIVLKSPSVTTPRHHSVYKIPLKNGKDIPWSYYLGCGYSAEVVNGVLVLTELHNKASYGDLEDRLKRDKILDPNSYKSLRSYAVNESLNLNEKKKKKKPYDSINHNAGNVEYSVAMFNKMNNPIAQPTVNPINGTTGEGCCEALEDRKKKLREGMRLTNGMKEDESLYFDDGDYSYHIFRRTPFGSNAETEWAVLVVDYGLRFHHDKMYKDEKTGFDTIPVDVVHDKPKKIAYFEFTDETLPEAANAFLDEDGKKFTEVIKAEAQKHIEITEDLDTDASPKDVITEVGKQELRDFLTSIICEREDDLALEFGEDDRLWDEFFEVNLESYTDKYREDIIKHFKLSTKED